MARKEAYMFDSFNLIGAAFAGDLKNDPDARKAFFSWVCMVAASVAGMAFMAVASYSSFKDLIGEISINWLFAGLLTSLLALTSWFIMSFQSYKTVGIWIDKPMSEDIKVFWKISWVILFVVIIVDVVLSNNGTEEMAEYTTASTIANRSSNVFDSYKSDIASLEAKKESLQEKYKYPDGVIHFAPKPTTSVSRAQYEEDFRQVSVLDAQIASLRELQASASKVALADYTTDQKRHERELGKKKSIYGWTVKLIYIPVFLFSLGAAAYAHRAEDIIARLAEQEEVPAQGKALFRDSIYPDDAQVSTPMVAQIGFRNAQVTNPAAPQPPTQPINPQLNQVLNELQALRARIDTQEFTKSPIPADIPENVRVNTVTKTVRKGPPNNKGKKYSSRKSMKQNLERFKHVWNAFVEEHDRHPLTHEMEKRTGFSPNTIRKYRKLSGFE